MQIKHSFTIAAPVDRVWAVMSQPEVVVKSLPGVELTSLQGDRFTGGMNVGLGPMRLKYAGAGTLRYDREERRIHIEARGTEARGAGDAAAVVDVEICPGAEDSTRVAALIEMNLQGRTAQFGRGILAEVITRLTGQFVRRLERQISAPAPEATAGDAAAADTSEAGPARAPAIGGAIAARAGGLSELLLPALAGAAVGLLLGHLLRRPSITIVVSGTDDPGWAELARELSTRRHRRRG